MPRPSLIDEAARLIHRGFERYLREFDAITRQAAVRFDAGGWNAARVDAAERLALYGRRVTEVERELETTLRVDYRDRETWRAMRTVYAAIIDGAILESKINVTQKGAPFAFALPFRPFDIFHLLRNLFLILHAIVGSLASTDNISDNQATANECVPFCMMHIVIDQLVFMLSHHDIVYSIFDFALAFDITLLLLDF